MVTTFLVLHEIHPDLKDAVLERCARALRPDGLLLLFDERYPSRPSELRDPVAIFAVMAQWYELIWGNLIDTREDIHARLERQGLRVADETALSLLRRPVSFIDTNAIEVGTLLGAEHGATRVFIFRGRGVPPGPVAAPHRYGGDEAIRVMRGRLRVRVSDQTRVIGPGEIACIPPHTDHAFIVLGEADVEVFGEQRMGEFVTVRHADGTDHEEVLPRDGAQRLDADAHDDGHDGGAHERARPIEVRPVRERRHRSASCGRAAHRMVSFMARAL